MKEIENDQYIGKIIKAVIDRPLGSFHPEFKFVYPVNYGYIPNVKSGDGEELDCYILGVDTPINEFEGECIAILHRLDEDDDKLILVPKGMNFTDIQIKEKTNFVEQYFTSEIIRKNRTI